MEPKPPKEKKEMEIFSSFFEAFAVIFVAACAISLSIVLIFAGMLTVLVPLVFAVFVPRPSWLNEANIDKIDNFYFKVYLWFSVVGLFFFHNQKLFHITLKEFTTGGRGVFFISILAFFLGKILWQIVSNEIFVGDNEYDNRYLEGPRSRAGLLRIQLQLVAGPLWPCLLVCFCLLSLLCYSGCFGVIDGFFYIVEFQLVTMFIILFVGIFGTD